MAKPILTIGISERFREDLQRLQAQFSEQLSDYHVIVYMMAVNDEAMAEPKFQAFYEKDFNEVKYEELKQIVKDSMA